MPAGIGHPRFREAVERLRMPGMGTEVVAPLLANLVHLVRPGRVLEIGMGYTTPFLASALAEVAATVEREARALAAKTAPYVHAGRELDAAWVSADPALLTPAAYESDYHPRLVSVDDLSNPDSSAVDVGGVLAELGLTDLVTVLNADLHDCADLLPADFTPIDFAWVDAWECLYFFENFWELINPDGGLVLMHYLMTYPEGETILDYLAEIHQVEPGEFELINLLETQKLAQNSITILRRTSGQVPRRYAELGGRLRVDDDLRRQARALTERTTPSTPAPSTPIPSTPAPSTPAPAHSDGSAQQAQAAHRTP